MSNFILCGEYTFSGSFYLQMKVLEHQEYGLLFPAVHIAEQLGYEKPHNAIQTHCKAPKRFRHPEIGNVEIIGLSKATGIIMITEADLFRLIMRSQLESAVVFQDWVVEEVLPAIRKNGSYSVNKTPLALGVKKQLEIYETFLSSNSLKDIQEFAAAYDKYGLGRNNVFNLLRDLKIIQKGKTIPYRKYLKQKYFKVYFCNDEFFNNKTVLTPKGVRWLSEVIENHMETVRLVTGQKTLLDY